MQNEVLRFLIAGGTAAAINWLARIILSVALPLPMAILIAYMVGMVFGFIMYRAFVFQRTGEALHRQIALFLIVNLGGAGIVVGATLAGNQLLMAAWPEGIPALREALSHGVAIAIGAVANYFGHRLITFARRFPEIVQIDAR